LATRGPQSVSKIVSEIMVRRGIGRQRATEDRNDAWQSAVGQEMAAVSCCGNIRRGKLEVIVANSLIVHELTFRKQEIIEKLKQTMPDVVVDDLRFRVGSVAPQ